VLGAALTAAAHRAGGARRHRLVPLETAGRHRPPSTIEKKKKTLASGAAESLCDFSGAINLEDGR